MKLFKKNKNRVYFKIAFCEEPDLATKFGESIEIFDTYDLAKNRVFSKVAGWGKASQGRIGDMNHIDGAWLIIEKCYKG